MSKNRRNKVIKIVSGALVCASVALSGCVNQHPEESVADVTKDNYRLVATSPAVAEITSKLDLDLVGISDTSKNVDDRYKDVTKVGYPMSPDVEIIKSLNPDYVLSPSTLKADLEPKYTSAGVESVFLNMESVEGMYASITEIGNKFGREQQAQELNKEFNEYMDSYRKQNEGKEGPRVLILMGLPGSYIVATESSYVGNIVKLAGGENVYGDGGGTNFINANTEDMRSKNPDVILRTAHTLPDDVKKMFAEEFNTNDIWKHFTAVQNGKVYDLDSNLFGMSATFGYPDALSALQPLLYGN